jgi:hypothetical protein
MFLWSIAEFTCMTVYCITDQCSTTTRSTGFPLTLPARPHKRGEGEKHVNRCGKGLVPDHNDNDHFPLTPGPSPTQAGRGEKCSRMAVARY